MTALRYNLCKKNLQTTILLPLEKLPPNVALLSVLSVNIETDPETYPDAKEEYSHIQLILVELAAYLHRAESERGIVISQDLLVALIFGEFFLQRLVMTKCGITTKTYLVIS